MSNEYLEKQLQDCKTQIEKLQSKNGDLEMSLVRFKQEHYEVLAAQSEQQRQLEA